MNRPLPWLRFKLCLIDAALRPLSALLDLLEGATAWLGARGDAIDFEIQARTFPVPTSDDSLEACAKWNR